MKPPLSIAFAFLVFAICQADLMPAAPPSTATAPAKSEEPFWPPGGVFSGKGKTSSWSGFREKNLQRRTLFAEHQATDQNALVFVGDSITEGWQTLDQDFSSLGIKVVNRGIGGDTTPNLLYRLQDDVLSLHPRALVILIGTNDIAELTPPADIANNLKTIRTQIRKQFPSIPIAWCLVMPRGNPALKQPVQELNALIRKLVEADSKITLCDSFTPLAQPDNFANPADFVPDLLHLNPSGYAVWRTALLPIVSRWKLAVPTQP